MDAALDRFALHQKRILACPDPDPYAAFPSLHFERPAAGVLRIVLDGPGLNAVGPDMHRELADVWLAVDRDPDVRVAIIQGAGKGFSAGGASSCSTR